MTAFPIGVDAARVEALNQEPLSVAWIRALMQAAGTKDCALLRSLLSEALQQRHGRLCDSGDTLLLLEAVGLAWTATGLTFNQEQEEHGTILTSIEDGHGNQRTLELVREDGFVRLLQVVSGD